jgi:hypothetical protein
VLQPAAEHGVQAQTPPVETHDVSMLRNLPPTTDNQGPCSKSEALHSQLPMHRLQYEYIPPPALSAAAAASAATTCIGLQLPGSLHYEMA